MAVPVDRSLRLPESEYFAAVAGYQDLSKRYVAELKQPHIRPGGVIELIAAAGAGVVLARAIHE